LERRVVIFEDDQFSRLYPLSLTRPVFDLVCGVFSLAEKVRLGLKAASHAGHPGLWRAKPDGEPDMGFHARDFLLSGVKDRVRSYEALIDGYNLITLINGRLLWRESLLDEIDPDRPGKYVCRGTVVWANVAKDRLGALDAMIGVPLDPAAFEDLPAEDIEASLVSYPWELVSMNGEEINRDFVRLGEKATEAKPSTGVHLVGEEAIRIGRNVKLSPGVVIDASQGPVSIDDDVSILPNASLAGPLHIGSQSIIKMGAKISGHTTSGPVSRVGGEVGETIIQGYSNKQHEGFVGHSYLGEWVNVGAGTETSDMKNNYSTVRVPIEGKPVDSGELFVGLFMGDHSKSGIGTIFNTGSAVGVCCNVFGSDYPPKYIPSFAWGGSAGFSEHDLEKAIETARRALGRRDRTLDANGENVLRKVFELTRDERRTFLCR
jgi:UDP-N-acetylglucosamine diphosphorylase/glucosamine-1-phosphate N-acetyltransferase